ncbi:hypothetical protein B0J15DRAFT_65094 [Fusarium solani]|uniref:Uncharacterized protein n=1 Tax=Fusarium solani TaxID=169388 RepID=A0A9P9H0Y3_FUSSL|nr:uncharacterized protein B0J15DRAFT_65094 [Fusarium solani]KAH7247867.1 hypothetical protein B0J15DRAFT_65094 [Fusarium solani]
MTSLCGRSADHSASIVNPVSPTGDLAWQSSTPRHVWLHVRLNPLDRSISHLSRPCLLCLLRRRQDWARRSIEKCKTPGGETTSSHHVERLLCGQVHGVQPWFTLEASAAEPPKLSRLAGIVDSRAESWAEARVAGCVRKERSKTPFQIDHWVRSALTLMDGDDWRCHIPTISTRAPGFEDRRPSLGIALFLKNCIIIPCGDTWLWGPISSVSTTKQDLGNLLGLRGHLGAYCNTDT